MHSQEIWAAVFGNPDKKEQFLNSIQTDDKKVGAFLEFAPEIDADPNNKNNTAELANIPFAVKDNIMVNEFKCTCASKMLENFKSPYNATSVQKLLDAGAKVVGKTNLDEFGMGSSTDNSALGVTNNPWKLSHVAGGSSGGSAAAVAAGYVPFALGTDTGGSVRQPASFCGIYGLKPTYGAVSRFGLVAYSSSMEVLGICAQDVAFTKKAFSIVKGSDVNDQTSSDRYNEIKETPVKTIGILQGDLNLHKDVQAAYDEAVERLKKLGYKVTGVKIPAMDYAIAVYYTIAAAEASANLARFNGIRYGHRAEKAENPIDLMQKSRDQGFGYEVKTRILLGSYVLRSGFQDQYYNRAQKIRTAVRNSLNTLFQEVDSIMMPVSPMPAYPHGEAALDQFQQKLADKFTVTANIAGVPALAVPVDVYDGLPLGVQFMSPHFTEYRLFEIAGKLEKAYPPAFCPGKIRLEQ